MVELAHDVHRENGIADYDDDLFVDVLEKHYSRTGAVAGVVGDVGGRLRGIFVVQLGRAAWYSRSWALEELFVYVRPEHRAEGLAGDLIEYLKAMSDQMGLPLVTGIFSSVRLEAKARLYRKHYGYPAGVLFVHNAPHNSTQDDKFGDWLLRSGVPTES